MSQEETPSEAAPGMREEVRPGGILHWRIERPARRNALSPAMLEWIRDRSLELRGEVVILSAEGPEAFCAGFDLGALEQERGVTDSVNSASSDRALPDQPLIEASAAMLNADATFIAVVHGYAIGAGVELAASCDFRLLGPEASFRVPAGRLGLVYHAEGLRRLHGIFGSSLTRRMVLAGETIGAEQVQAAGACEGLYPADALLAAATKLAEALARQLPASRRENRRLLRALEGPPLTPALQAEHERSRIAAYASSDHRSALEKLRKGPPTG